SRQDALRTTESFHPLVWIGHSERALANFAASFPKPERKTMSPFTAELIGTMILVLLGDGVVANVLLNKSKGQNSGWIVITTGWGLAVTVAIYAVGTISQGHLNPAVD